MTNSAKVIDVPFSNQIKLHVKSFQIYFLTCRINSHARCVSLYHNFHSVTFKSNRQLTVAMDRQCPYSVCENERTC